MVTETPHAIIFVDGKRIATYNEGEGFLQAFQEAVDTFGGEVSLLVYKPRYKTYLRQKLSITGRKRNELQISRS